MRPPRIIILTLFSAACLFLFCRAIASAARPAPAVSSPRTREKSTLRSFFSFTTPFALFPPNAIITIADDNSTSFAARPAAFGPPLPSRGLNGQLWVGSGFSEETIVDGEGEGELGCSDVPGWNDGTSISALKPPNKGARGKAQSSTQPLRAKNQKPSNSRRPTVDDTAPYDSGSHAKKPVDDGTDDYLHQHLDTSQRLTGDALASSGSGHADIQSIQEGAEIEGKIVLLSRGGCGFLEKVKWAQRRGAIGLIVGDNQRGGPLIHMYAHGDTSNVTIPSIFTSRTTAYLLSLMMQPGSFIEDSIDDSGKPIQKVQQYDKLGGRRTPTTNGNPQIAKSAAELRGEGAAQLRDARSQGTKKLSARSGWLSWLFGGSSQSKSAADGADAGGGSGSKRLDWVLVEDYIDEKDKSGKNSLDASAYKSKGNGRSRPDNRQTPQDSFQIGVEDWRDPDLVGVDKSGQAPQDNGKASKSGTKFGQTHSEDNREYSGPGHASTRPSTGDYVTNQLPAKGKDAIGFAKGSSAPSGNPGFISKLFGDGGDVDTPDSGEEHSLSDLPPVSRPDGFGTPPPPEEREGLWVVITPTSGASPFFDTLLVLVVSPLITLTVVYALLILRARIRRRRWRAPKSVVDRLPVRTYHTLSSSPSRSPRVPSPASASPTMPLLQGQHGPSRARPRSRTTTGVPSAGDLLEMNVALSLPGTSRPEEKHTGSSEWKRYRGRQVECVVCLEEYVDGVSQVMSLPCGHEFHVDCITPWLTTRRRTCPICKGDVVRSLARGSPSGTRYEPYQDDNEEDGLLGEEHGASSSNSRPEEDNGDLEQGLPTVRHVSRRSGWLNAFLGGIRDRISARQTPIDTDVESRDR
ncbi:hypothetical protein F5Y17DRAFT_414055 [Xylariaceae sp. FL0594]|nr:hypothetical protein F5Y17DRAFT_414055 [Xylariaceae sp. FL0594]